MNISLDSGQMMAVVGESGSGKSTLLHILGALDKASSGEIYFEGRALSQLSEAERSQFRNRDIGFVWQMHCLLPEFTARENVMMPLLINGQDHSEAAARANHLLEQVGLTDRGGHRAGELSGGEQQRVSLARALARQPKLLLADEPTGNLDARTGGAVMELIENLHRSEGMTTLLVTHNLAYARRCDQAWKLTAGRLEAVTFP
ncbi:MAG: ABC transporter ATP-binding protein [Acidobacteria bacterium]|nr:ABC transporter ATP-binding protein [Acidobacteriota bacterium]